jgi:nucleoside phosphorylase
MALSMTRLTLLGAMRAEADPLIRRLGLQPAEAPWPEWAPCRLWRGRAEGVAIDLVIAGRDERHACDWIGTEPATLAATLAVLHLSPRLMASVGTAGGFRARGAEVGTVYLSQGPFRYHGRNTPLPGFQESVRGGHESLDTTALANVLQLPQGAISTGSSFARTATELAEIAESGAVAKEMEAAAQAWVAEQAGVPFFAVKAITNLLDEPTASEEQFPANLALASTRLAETVAAIVKVLGNRSFAK